jgi:phosphomannomutase
MKPSIESWLARDPDPQSRAELEALVAGKEQEELQRRFAGRLEFGTAGLRGVVGCGPAMMNRLVIRETSAGLGSYLLTQLENSAQRGIVIAYDGRLDSRQFAEDAACTFAAQGITAYLTPDVAATPVAAYTVLKMSAAAAVVVTASHNPPQYNGYKVYWENGAQIIPPHDAGIAAAIELAADAPLPWVDFESARAAGTIRVLGEEVYREYIDSIQDSPIFGRETATRSIGIAYTAMHGVGADIAQTLLLESGFDKFYSVPEQSEPDGRFPTVNFPNPEEPGAMDAVLALASSKQADLACANDPDADRLAVAVRTPTGDYHMLSGDMLGVLLANHLLKKQHSFVPIVCTTIVSSRMLKSVASATGAVFCETLTGFKWLSNEALAREDARHQFLFAYEEALGYCCGRQVRDKDGLSALLAFAQMADELAREGRSVLDELEALYRQHGIFLTQQHSIALQAGAIAVGDALRSQPPSSIAGVRVASTDDLRKGRRYNADGSTEEVNFPTSDVLIYRLENNSRIIVRPSGTEPKVKCYYEVIEPVAAKGFAVAMNRARQELDDLVRTHQKELAATLNAAS